MEDPSFSSDMPHEGAVVQKETIDRIITAVARSLDVDVSQITLESAIGSISEWDSLGHLAVISGVEDEFGVSFSIEEVVEIESVEDFVDLLSSGDR